MVHKIVVFSDSNDLINREYMQNQLDAISIIFSDVEIEHVNENDPRLALYTATPERLPCIMIFKYGAKKRVTHAKFSERDFIEWVVDTLG